MSVATHIFELAHPAMEDPKLAGAALVLGAGATAAEMAYRHYEARLHTDAPPIADPELAEAALIDGHRTRRLGRLGYYAATAWASLALVQAAHPFTNHSRVEGCASAVIDTGYNYDANDMHDHSGQPTTRLLASIEGSLAAAKDRNVPFTFILEGQAARTVDTIPADNKDLKRTKQLIDHTIDPTFRNGESLADGVQQALSSGCTGPNEIIILAADMRTSDQRNLQDLQKNLKRDYPGDNLHAVVVGQGIGENQVGNVTLKSGPDIKAFTELLGQENVQTANSTAQVEKAVDHFASEVKIVNKKKEIHDYGHLALVAAGLMAVVAIRRGLSGITRLIRERS